MKFSIDDVNGGFNIKVVTLMEPFRFFTIGTMWNRIELPIVDNKDVEEKSLIGISSLQDILTFALISLILLVFYLLFFSLSLSFLVKYT